MEIRLRCGWGGEWPAARVSDRSESNGVGSTEHTEGRGEVGPGRPGGVCRVAREGDRDTGGRPRPRLQKLEGLR